MATMVARLRKAAIVVVARAHNCSAAMSAPTSTPASTAIPAPVAARAPAIDAFVAAVRAAIVDGGFESVVLAKNRHGDGEPRAIRIRRIALKGEPALTFVASHATRDVTRKCAIEDGLVAIAGHLDRSRAPAFAHATLRTRDGATQLLIGKKGNATLRLPRRAAPAATAAAPAAPTSHDRERLRHLPVELPFLV